MTIRPPHGSRELSSLRSPRSKPGTGDTRPCSHPDHRTPTEHSRWSSPPCPSIGAPASLMRDQSSTCHTVTGQEDTPLWLAPRLSRSLTSQVQRCPGDPTTRPKPATRLTTTTCPSVRTTARRPVPSAAGLTTGSRGRTRGVPGTGRPGRPGRPGRRRRSCVRGKVYLNTSQTMPRLSPDHHSYH